MKVTTTTGIELDTEGGLSKQATQYAKEKGLDIVCCMATHPNGAKEYVLIENNIPIYASTQYEAVCVHIDILGLAERV